VNSFTLIKKRDEKREILVAILLQDVLYLRVLVYNTWEVPLALINYLG